MESGGRRAPQERLATNQHVSGAVGEFIEGPSKRRRRQRWFGHIAQAVGEKRYLVRTMERKESCHQQFLKWSTWLHLSSQML